MQKVYFISGLGADSRVFSLLDLSFCEPVFINWIKPQDHESLSGYSKRIRMLIPDPHPIVVGLSLGGMIATEIAKQDDQAKAIIISSNKSGNELPSYLRMFRYMPVYKAIPGSAMKKLETLYTKTFGVKELDRKKLMYEMIADSDMEFVKWGIEAIVNWDNRDVPFNVIHIHGTADRLLPFKKVKAQYQVEGGGHVLTLDKAEEVSAILKELITVVPSK